MFGVEMLSVSRQSFVRGRHEDFLAVGLRLAKKIEYINRLILSFHWSCFCSNHGIKSPVHLPKLKIASQIP